MKIRRQLRRRMAASYVKAQAAAAFTREIFPAGWVHTFPLRGRAVAMFKPAD